MRQQTDANISELLTARKEVHHKGLKDGQRGLGGSRSAELPPLEQHLQVVARADPTTGIKRVKQELAAKLDKKRLSPKPMLVIFSDLNSFMLMNYSRTSL